MTDSAEKFLEVKDLKTYFFTTKGAVKAVDGISFSITKGDVIGLVGESGCGKSITSLSIMGLVPQPTGKIVGGQILFYDEDLLKKSEEEMRRIRGDKIAMILQDPMVSLNPILRVERQIGEVFKYHNKIRGKLRDMCINVLKKVKVPSPELRIKAYPFQFSGGMCQRVIIGMGVANNPELLIADEPTTALDVTIQSQILQLIKQVQQETNTAVMMITHDLATVAQICNRVLVMYAGRIVEKAPVKAFYKSPAHPYSVGLINSVPVLGKKNQRLSSIEGQPPNLLDPLKGCRFAARCDQVMQKCLEEYPPETTIDVANNHRVSCWLYTEEKE